MADVRPPNQVYPGRGLGWITLGASLHSILSRLKAQPNLYPKIDLSYSSPEPISHPVVLGIPSNGLRLRFDGPDQRLRLIEVTDFTKASLIYKNIELVRRNRSSEVSDQEVSQHGPPFRHVYNRLFGPTYPGEYAAPDPGHQMGTYVLSYPGIAFTFPFKHKYWSDKSDFVSLLSSTAAHSASCLAIFSGASWPEARGQLYTKPPVLPRSLALSGRHAENFPDEIEEVTILGGGRLLVHRRSSPPFSISLNETTPQDLVTELGPPDAIYRKNDSRISIHKGTTTLAERRASPPPGARAQSTETDHSSTRSHAEESDPDGPEVDQYSINPECFYNYFHHGFDALVSFPTSRPPDFPDTLGPERSTTPDSQLVITKILLHANIPGSYPFNRHRRSRWKVKTTPEDKSAELSSEMPFSEVSKILKRVWHHTYSGPEEERSMQRGMVLNRGWGESPESSIEFLGEYEEGSETSEQAKDKVASNLPGLSNTELFGFPGLLFEVLKNDAISCLTVY